MKFLKRKNKKKIKVMLHRLQIGKYLYHQFSFQPILVVNYCTMLQMHILSSIYASATLCSSLLLIWVGKKIDDINIFRFAIYVTLLLSFSCFFFSKISSIVFLFIAIFLMRFSGQGMMSHTATTTVSRYFTKSRGRALSICWFGLSSAEH